MAAETGTVWAIDIGNNSLKALYLSTERGVVEVIGFDNIQHSKILTGSDVTDVEREELTALSLRKLVNKYDLSLEEIAVSVPSQNSFARFVNMPPVEQKRIPEMVKFEAVQQIPFGINDVQWDWQVMTEPDSPEIKVGIFAIKNEVVNSALEHFNREDVQVSYVQMAPMALYNYLLHDRPDLVTSDSQAIVILNIGAENTDLVVCTKSTVWQRCILLGGNAFTKAIAETFRLNFEKAEKLKRTAPVSKYARQIFQAMRPVFTDLVSEIQRSLNFYGNSNPNTKLVKVIAAGGGTKMRGLLKYLRQTLQLPVERLDSFKKLALGEGMSAAKFHENVSDFAIVYGLALQGLGLGKIESNLLPRNIARSMVWAGKAKYFTAAASVLLLISLMSFARANLESIRYERNEPVRHYVSDVLGDAQDAQGKLDDQVRKGKPAEAKILKAFEPFKYRQVVPQLYQLIVSALPNRTNTEQQADLYEAFISGDVEKVKTIPRKERRQIFLTNVSVRFVEDVNSATLGETALVSADSVAAKQQMEDDDEEYELMQIMRMRGGKAPRYLPPQWRAPGGAPAVIEQPGFVVTIQGYSPYKYISELIDPVGVEGRPEKWGFITRLLHLDPNCPFELFKKTEIKHFEPRWDEVDLAPEKQMPVGIGVPEIRMVPWDQSGERVLIDPMTKEIISKVVEVDEKGNRRIDPKTGKFVYAVNDHWFELKLKFAWKNAPPKPADTDTSLTDTEGSGYPPS